jgi:hypothetical protein
VKRLALILILTLSATTASAVPTAAQDDQYTDPFAWKKCSAKVSSSLKITAVRRMRCKAAKRVMRRYDGSISRKFSTAGFNCKRVKGRAASGIWRCRKGSRKAFRFRSATNRVLRSLVRAGSHTRCTGRAGRVGRVQAPDEHVSASSASGPSPQPS